MALLYVVAYTFVAVQMNSVNSYASEFEFYLPEGGETVQSMGPSIRVPFNGI